MPVAASQYPNIPTSQHPSIPWHYYDMHLWNWKIAKLGDFGDLVHREICVEENLQADPCNIVEIITVGKCRRPILHLFLMMNQFSVQQEFAEIFENMQKINRIDRTFHSHALHIIS